MSFTFKKLDIPDVVSIQPEVFGDERGSFAELYKTSAFEEQGISVQFNQHNRSVSKRGVLRGLHFQMNPMAQGKLVSVLAGSIYDVAVDIRRKSKHYGQWVSAELSAENGAMLYIPEGFAHAFCVISDDAEILYFSTKEYAPELERGITWDDPDLAIDWPIDDLVLSDRDRKFPRLKEVDNNFN